MQQYALISDPDHCIEWLWAWLCDFCSSPSNKLSYTHSALHGIPMLWNPASTVAIGVGTLPCTQCLKSSCISTAPSFLWAFPTSKWHSSSMLEILNGNYWHSLLKVVKLFTEGTRLHHCDHQFCALLFHIIIVQKLTLVVEMWELLSSCWSPLFTTWYGP